jgi:hypothetical protein
MVKAVNIYIEGSGAFREQKAKCRLAFQTLCEKMGFKGKMPSIRACGTRNQAYKDFVNALKINPQAINILLVDSEDTLKNLSPDPHSDIAWIHLNLRDGWIRPADTEPYQALIMATSMETWIATDREALKAFFGKDLQENALPTLPQIESQNRKEVFKKLEHATRNCKRPYQKGDQSFKILETLDPATLHQHLTQFQRLKATLDIVLNT